PVRAARPRRRRRARARKRGAVRGVARTADGTPAAPRPHAPGRQAGPQDRRRVLPLRLSSAVALSSQWFGDETCCDQTAGDTLRRSRHAWSDHGTSPGRPRLGVAISARTSNAHGPFALWPALWTSCRAFVT